MNVLKSSSRFAFAGRVPQPKVLVQNMLIVAAWHTDSARLCEKSGANVSQLFATFVSSMIEGKLINSFLFGSGGKVRLSDFFCSTVCNVLGVKRRLSAHIPGIYRSYTGRIRFTHRRLICRGLRIERFADDGACLRGSSPANCVKEPSGLQDKQRAPNNCNCWPAVRARTFAVTFAVI